MGVAITTVEMRMTPSCLGARSSPMWDVTCEFLFEGRMEPPVFFRKMMLGLQGILNGKA